MGRFGRNTQIGGEDIFVVFGLKLVVQGGGG
jgi:hypothetical protein